MIDHDPNAAQREPARAAPPAPLSASAPSDRRREIDCTSGVEDHGPVTRRKSRGGTHRERDVIAGRPPRGSGAY